MQGTVKCVDIGSYGACADFMPETYSTYDKDQAHKLYLHGSILTTSLGL